MTVAVSLIIVAVAAIVPRSAIPIDPPICCPTLRRAEARPDSAGVEPETAISVSGTKMLPSPTAISNMGPTRPVRYVVWSLICDSQKRPPATSSGPIVMNGRVPNRPTSRATTCAVMMMAAVNGRNATPATSGLKPRMFCTNCVRKKNTPKTATPIMSEST